MKVQGVFWQATRASLLTAAAFAAQQPRTVPHINVKACAGCTSTTVCANRADLTYFACMILNDECYNSNRQCSH